jgi:hypothetical protein
VDLMGTWVFLPSTTSSTDYVNSQVQKRTNWGKPRIHYVLVERPQRKVEVHRIKDSAAAKDASKLGWVYIRAVDCHCAVVEVAIPSHDQWIAVRAVKVFPGKPAIPWSSRSDLRCLEHVRVFLRVVG